MPAATSRRSMRPWPGGYRTSTGPRVRRGHVGLLGQAGPRRDYFFFGRAGLWLLCGIASLLGFRLLGIISSQARIGAIREQPGQPLPGCRPDPKIDEGLIGEQVVPGSWGWGLSEGEPEDSLLLVGCEPLTDPLPAGARAAAHVQTAEHGANGRRHDYQEGTCTPGRGELPNSKRFCGAGLVFVRPGVYRTGEERPPRR